MFFICDLPTILAVGRDRSCSVHTQYKYLYYLFVLLVVCSSFLGQIITNFALRVGGLPSLAA